VTLVYAFVVNVSVSRGMVAKIVVLWYWAPRHAQISAVETGSVLSENVGATSVSPVTIAGIRIRGTAQAIAMSTVYAMLMEGAFANQDILDATALSLLHARQDAERMEFVRKAFAFASRAGRERHAKFQQN